MELLGDKRYFLNLPSPERRAENGVLGVLPLGRIPLPLMGQRTIETDAKRGWVEVQEEDTHWFIFHAKPVVPEPGAM